MRTVFIYALCEPGTRTVRYIGKTVSLRRRLREHVQDSLKKKTYLGSWLRSLLGEPPNMVMLREVPEAEGSAAEIKYIRLARESLGMPLVNGTEGGDGISRGHVFPPEHRAKLSAAMIGEKNPMFGEHHSAETRAKLSAALSGRKLSPESNSKRSATLTGRKLSAEVCAKRSAAMTGKKHSPERCARKSAAQMGQKQSPESNAKRRATMTGQKRSVEARANMSAAWTPERRAAHGTKIRAANERREALKNSQCPT